jgi:hypothetical protein
MALGSIQPLTASPAGKSRPVYRDDNVTIMCRMSKNWETQRPGTLRLVQASNGIGFF